VLKVPDQAVALLAVLMLRGPQTAGELRGARSACTHLPTCHRSRRFSPNWPSAPRSAVARSWYACSAHRVSARRVWAHLLSGPVAASNAPVRGGRGGRAIEAQVARLVAEVEALRAEVAEFASTPSAG